MWPLRSLMATVPDNGMLRPPEPAPLGAILVRRGVLTEEQLAVALDEQKRTGEQIGEVIVRLGLALASSVAQALATQYGGPLKTEYGYAVGFGGPSPAASADPPPISPPAVQNILSTAPAPASALRAAVPPQVAPTQTSVSAPVATAGAVPAPPAPDPALQWQQHAQGLAAERDAALQQGRALAAERDAAGADIDAMKARAAELEATTARLTTELETLRRMRDADAQRRALLEQGLEEAKTARAQVVELEVSQAEHIRARDESAQRVAELEQQLDELLSAASRVVELEVTTTLAEVERATLIRARDDAVRRSADLERQLALLNERVAARTGELEAELASARDEAERGADEAERRNAQLERRVAELQQTAASHGELAVATSLVGEFEVSATLAESENATLERAREGAAESNGQLEAVREEAVRFQRERTALAWAHEEAVSRNADLERQLTELRTAVVSDDEHLAAATARVAELEAVVQAARESELGVALAGAREEAERIKVEKVALETMRESLARRNADLEGQLKQLEAADAHVTRLEQHAEEAAAQIAQLEAERNDALAVANGPGEERRSHHPDEHAEDPSHLLFIPGADGYRLLEQEGPPPAPGSTLEFAEDDGTRSRLLVAKVCAAPLPSVRLKCAYLVVTA
jgi:chromosome segregation ATPase